MRTLLMYHLQYLYVYMGSKIVVLEYIKKILNFWRPFMVWAGNMGDGV